MASTEANYLNVLYQDWSNRMANDPEMPIEALRSMFEEWHKATLEAAGVSFESGQLGGVEGIWVYPNDGDKSKVLMYTHGGGFAVGSAHTHRKLAGHMAKALGVTAFVLDYRLAPEHPYPAQVEDAVAVFNALLASGITADNIATIGDSAGGNLAIATALRLRELGSEMPGCVIAFSPWVDMEMTGGTLESNAATDALVQRPVLEGMRDMFLGGTTAPEHPIASPIKADFKGFPPLYINAGTDETLLDDSLRIHELALSAGVNSTISVVDEMQHVFPFLAGRAPEADEEIGKIASWYKAL